MTYHLPIVTLGHGVWQIDSICQTKLVRQLASSLPYPYDGKIHESKPFADFS